MVCACATGSWSTGTVNTNKVTTEQINNFLGMTQKNGENGFWPVPQVTDSGVTSSANYASLAATAVAVYNTVAAAKIADKQYDIAKAYYNIARNKWDRFRNYYEPCERTEVNEACNAPEYTPLYTDTSTDWANSVTRTFADGDTQRSGLLTLYCLCGDDSLNRARSLEKTVARLDTINYAYRYEEARKVARDDVRWTRRQQALNRGRDLESQALNYAKLGSQAYGDVSSMINQATSGAIEAIGYFNNRRDTVYPKRSAAQYPGNQAGAVGGSFIGASPQNGTYGFIADAPQLVGGDQGFIGTSFDSLRRYDVNASIYSQNSSIDSNIGAQNPSAGL